MSCNLPACRPSSCWHHRVSHCSRGSILSRSSRLHQPAAASFSVPYAIHLLYVPACVPACLSAGPLVVGITVSAIAVGAAFSAGALAFTSLLLPLIVLSGIGGLMSFGVVAALGAALVVPKMIFSALSLVSYQLSMHMCFGECCAYLMFSHCCHQMCKRISRAAAVGCPVWHWRLDELRGCCCAWGGACSAQDDFLGTVTGELLACTCPFRLPCFCCIHMPGSKTG